MKGLLNINRNDVLLSPLYVKFFLLSKTESYLI